MSYKVSCEASICRYIGNPRWWSHEYFCALCSLIGFGFNCHDPSFHAGMSVPLLSVALASLMALFRSETFATRVDQDELTILIREAGKALLDPRLASSSSAETSSRLDEATSTQMVRAINKVNGRFSLFDAIRK